jgi:tRNA U34 5-carboxymethylaminomethyl modifying GTPase MnmE/TrmE
MNCNELKLVLLGESGAGKSQLGNFILKSEDEFEIGVEDISKTDRILSRSNYIDGTEVTIVDTPGYKDTNSEKKDDVLLNSIVTFFKGNNSIDGIIYVENFGVERKYKRDKILVNYLKTIFGEQFLSQRLKVVFTHTPYSYLKINKILKSKKDNIINHFDKMITENDIIFIDTIDILGNLNKNEYDDFYSHIKTLLDAFKKIKGKLGSIDSNKINYLKIQNYDKQIEEYIDRIIQTENNIDYINRKIKDDNAAIAASSVFVPLTLGFSGFGIKHCLDSKKEHQAELDRAEYRLEDLRKKLDELKKKKMDEN